MGFCLYRRRELATQGANIQVFDSLRFIQLLVASLYMPNGAPNPTPPLSLIPSHGEQRGSDGQSNGYTVNVYRGWEWSRGWFHRSTVYVLHLQRTWPPTVSGATLLPGLTYLPAHLARCIHWRTSLLPAHHSETNLLGG